MSEKIETAFVSGHLDLTKEEFIEHYVPQIRAAMDRGCAFVVGDARGADSLAQSFFAAYGANACVFHMFVSPRNIAIASWPRMGGFKSDDARDAAMTAASDFDIAWVRPGRERSGTARNIERRRARS